VFTIPACETGEAMTLSINAVSATIATVWATVTSVICQPTHHHSSLRFNEQQYYNISTAIQQKHCVIASHSITDEMKAIDSLLMGLRFCCT